MSGSKLIVLFVLTSLITALAYGGYMARNTYIAKQVEAERLHAEALEEQEKQKQAEAQRIKARNDKFDSLLNGLIKDIGTAAKEYKVQRTILKEMLKPYNFKDQPSAAETYKTYIGVIAPGLRERANTVIGVFSKYQELADTTLQDIPAEEKKVFLEKWEAMHKEQIDKYINFFEKEEKIIQAYKDLLEFYYKQAADYTYDTKSERIIFLKTEAKKKEEILALTLNNLLSPKK